MDGRLGEGRDGTTVVVVGSINADLLVSVPRLPAPGETVIGGRFRRAPGGKGGNQAAAAARLGAQTWLVGCVGDDDPGREARQELCKAGVDTSLLAVGRAPTGVAAVITDTAGENAIAVASGANDELDADLVRVACAAVPAADAVVLACLEIPDEAVLAAAEVAAARGWPFVLNPAPARPLAPELLRRWPRRGQFAGEAVGGVGAAYRVAWIQGLGDPRGDGGWTSACRLKLPWPPTPAAALGRRSRIPRARSPSASGPT
jgi:sugar/nucleoside kinase (ribokinase family)